MKPRGFVQRTVLQAIPQHIALSYSQLKQDVLGLTEIPSGSLGTLVEKQCNPNSEKTYLYRAFSTLEGKKKFELIGSMLDQDKVLWATNNMALFKEAKETLKSLRAAGYSMVDKSGVEILAALFNEGLVGPREGSLVAVGTTAYCALIGDLGLKSSAIMTRDVDLAVPSDLELATPVEFSKIIKTALPDFFPVPGLPSHQPSTSLKGPGANAMRVDLLVDGVELGKIAPVKKLDWHAQSIPHLQWLTEHTRVCLVMCSTKAVPVRTPEPVRFAFHKAYCSLNRTAIDADKSAKDKEQSLALLAYLEQADEDELIEEFKAAPQPIKDAVLKVYAQIHTEMPQWLEHI